MTKLGLPATEELDAVGLRFAQEGAVATVTLHRPEVRNAQTPAMWLMLARLGETMPDSVRVVVVTGAGSSFSAGLDRRLLAPSVAGPGSITELLTLPDGEAEDIIDGYQRGFTWLRDPRFITIAAVRGYALGAGFQLALACDLRVLTEDAQFAMKEITLGLVPDLTGTKPLVDAVGYSRALELCTTGRMVTADEAHRIGLAHQVVGGPELDAAVAALADAVLVGDPTAVRETKGLLLTAGELALDGQRLVERRAQVRRFRDLAAVMGQGR